MSLWIMGIAFVGLPQLVVSAATIRCLFTKVSRSGALLEVDHLEGVEVLLTNGRSASDLNAAFVASTAELVVVAEPDCSYDDVTVRRLVAPLVQDRVLAFAQAEIQHASANGWLARSWIAARRVHHRHEQRLRSDQRLAFALDGHLMAFRRKTVVDTGGFDGTRIDTVADLAYRLSPNGGCGVHVAAARAVVHAPTSLGEIFRATVLSARARAQALHRFGLCIATSSPGKARTLGLAYLLEFFVGPSALALGSIALLQRSASVPFACAILLMGMTPLSRALLTWRTTKSLTAVTGDFALRFLDPVSIVAAMFRSPAHDRATASGTDHSDAGDLDIEVRSAHAA